MKKSDWKTFFLDYELLFWIACSFAVAAIGVFSVYLLFADGEVFGAIAVAAFFLFFLRNAWLILNELLYDRI